MLWGIVFSIVAGMAMSVQGVMNTRLGEGIGNTEANVFVQGTAFLLAAAVLLFHRDGSFTELGQVNKLYWLGGVLGIVITLTVMLGIKSLDIGHTHIAASGGGAHRRIRAYGERKARLFVDEICGACADDRRYAPVPLYAEGLKKSLPQSATPTAPSEV